MNDEIREILARLSRCVITPDVRHDFDDLLDYITNLQQENERLKENAIHNDKVVDKAKWNEMIYKSRCEKAFQYVDNVPISHYEKGYMEDGILISKRVIKNILQNGSENDE